MQFIPPYLKFSAVSEQTHVNGQYFFISVTKVIGPSKDVMDSEDNHDGGYQEGINGMAMFENICTDIKNKNQSERPP